MADYVNQMVVKDGGRQKGDMQNGSSLLTIVAVSFGLLCVLQATLNISLRLADREREHAAINQTLLERSGQNDTSKGQLNRERDQLNRERDLLNRERDHLNRERDQLNRGRDQLNRERDQLNRERAKVNMERDQLNRERDQLKETYIAH